MQIQLLESESKGERKSCTQNLKEVREVSTSRMVVIVFAWGLEDQNIAENSDQWGNPIRKKTT